MIIIPTSLLPNTSFLQILNERTFPEFPIDKVEGKHLTSKWLKQNDGFKRPVLVEGKCNFKKKIPILVAMNPVICMQTYIHMYSSSLSLFHADLLDGFLMQPFETSKYSLHFIHSRWKRCIPTSGPGESQ